MLNGADLTGPPPSTRRQEAVSPDGTDLPTDEDDDTLMVGWHRLPARSELGNRCVAWPRAGRGEWAECHG